MILLGRVWKFGDNLTADQLVSGRYDQAGMARNWEECGKHVLEDVDPTFVQKVKKGDIIVAGNSFGSGHAHYHMQAIMGCREAGVWGFIAKSFNGLFLRAAINSGFPAWPHKEILAMVQAGDELEVDLATGLVRNHTSRQSIKVEPVPEDILEILRAGGLEQYTLRRVGIAV